MLYLVGGVSRAGKSSLATVMNVEHRVPWLSLDALRWSLTQGAPILGIDSHKDDKKDAIRLWPILEAFAENVLFDGRDYLIEGVCLLPEQIDHLTKENADEVRGCFLGYPSADVEEKLQQVIAYDGPNDWLRKEPMEKIHAFLNSRIAQSRIDLSVCRDLGIGFFDTYTNFERQIRAAKDHLLR